MKLKQLTTIGILATMLISVSGQAHAYKDLIKGANGNYLLICNDGKRWGFDHNPSASAIETACANHGGEVGVTNSGSLPTKVEAIEINNAALNSIKQADCPTNTTLQPNGTCSAGPNFRVKSKRPAIGLNNSKEVIPILLEGTEVCRNDKCFGVEKCNASGTHYKFRNGSWTELPSGHHCQGLATPNQSNLAHK